MPIRILGTLCFSIIFLNGAVAQTELPGESQHLLRQLAAFEKEEQAKAEAAIFAKRVLVIEALKKHLENETKKGNLDTALALRKKIEELARMPGSSGGSAPSVAANQQKILPRTIWAGTSTATGSTFKFSFKTSSSIEMNARTTGGKEVLHRGKLGWDEAGRAFFKHGNHNYTIISIARDEETLVARHPTNGEWTMRRVKN